MRTTKKIAIIGASGFREDHLYSLFTGGAVDELDLIEPEDEGLMQRLSNAIAAMPLEQPVKISECSVKNAASADIVILAKTPEAFPGESQRENLFRRAVQIKITCEELRVNGFRSIVVVAVSPVDLLSKVALNSLRVPARQVIGSAKSLSEFFDQETAEIATGAVWCAARDSCVSSIENCDPNCPGFETMVAEDRLKPVKISKNITPGQLFSVGTCIPVICRSVLRSERTILPVSAYLTGQYGITNVFLNQPCVISDRGVEKIIELRIDPAERRALAKSAAVLRSLEDEITRHFEITGVQEKINENTGCY